MKHHIAKKKKNGELKKEKKGKQKLKFVEEK